MRMRLLPLAAAVCHPMLIASGASAGMTDVGDVVDFNFVSFTSTGNPIFDLEFTIIAEYSASAPAGSYIEDFDVSLVGFESGFDLIGIDIVAGDSASVTAMIDVFDSTYQPDASFFWVIDPVPDIDPAFSVSMDGGFPLPISMFGHGDSVLLTFSVSSGTTLNDGVFGVDGLGTYIPAPSSVALLLVGTVFGSRRRRQA